MAIKPSKEDYQKLYAASSKSPNSILQWAHTLAASRPEDQFKQGYFRTLEFKQISNNLSARISGDLIVTGAQGVGKTAILRQLYYEFNPPTHSNLHDLQSILILWGDQHDQFHSVSKADNEYFAYHPVHGNDARICVHEDYRDTLLAEVKIDRFVPIKVPKGRKLNATELDLESAEKLLGKAKCERLKEKAWFNYLSRSRLILIDLPDYARTDKRLLNRHLNEIQRLWTKLKQLEKPPILVIAIQKELIRGHFFFDKMDKIELRPLSTDQLLSSYEEIFGSTYPFTEAALLTLALRSRGNYRRFKRYVAIAIESWPQDPSCTPITDEHVKRVISTERVAEDLDVELEQVFPKNHDSRREAVRILLYLSDSAPLEQGELAKVLGIPDYTLSRLLSKLELHRYITRRAHGLQKIVSLIDI